VNQISLISFSCKRVVFTALGLCLLGNLLYPVSTLYFTEPGTDTIFSSNLDGTGLTEVISSIQLDGPGGIEVDLTNNFIYFTDTDPISGITKIARSDLNGGGITDLVSDSNDATSLGLDLAGGKIYWSSSANGTIQRSNLDGSNVETVLTGINLPFGMEVDPVSGKLFIAERGTAKILRANLDGSGLETIVSGLGFAGGVGLDRDNNKVYWVDSGTTVDPSDDNIGRSNLDGTSQELVIAPIDAANNPNPKDVAVDALSGKIFWLEGNFPLGGQLVRADLDGTNIEVLLTGRSTLSQLTLGVTLTAIPEPSHIGALLGLLALAAVAYNRRLRENRV